LETTAPDRLAAASIKAVGFGVEPVSESLRRLGVLAALKPGVYCRDKTWGFGVVKRLDDFYAKVTIDFARKAGHQMTFAYAGETLEILNDEHLFVRLHVNPEGMRDLASREPDEVVRLALRSLGAMTVVQLKECLSPALLEEADWKGFWDAARKRLKDDARVEIPDRRSERIQLRDRAKAYDEDWFESLRTERLVDRVLECVGELDQAGLADDITDAQRDIVANRLDYSARAVEASDPVTLSRVLLLAARMGVSDSLDVRERCLDELMSAGLVAAMAGIGQRERTALLGMLVDADSERLVRRLAGVIHQLPSSAIGDIMAFLDARERLQPCLDRIRHLVDRRETSPELQAWIVRHLDECKQWQLCSLNNVAVQTIEVLELSTSGEGLKAQRSMRDLFLDNDWLMVVLGPLPAAQRMAVLKRVERSSGWDTSERRSVMARMVKLFPELAAALASPEEAEDASPRRRFTSWRSLRERQEQYKKLVEEEIPANSKEIAVARSYGDLRENFEYQAAKDMQRLLLQRQAEMEADLSVVQGTDFSGSSTETVGMGTQVVLQREGRDPVSYCILGEWDRDEELSVISNRSLLAQRLEGQTVGSEVSIPVDGDDEVWRVASISALPDPVLVWAR
jgi:transcription elongation GreA/GreB family factor